MNFYKGLEFATNGDSRGLDEALAALRYNSDGLIPAIAQQQIVDGQGGEVLMMAWMNEASIRESLKTGRVCYWSRSRQQYWRKGEESGNVQQLLEMRTDCDGDTLLLTVNQTGPACHTNRRDCFYNKLDANGLTVDEIKGPA